MRRAVADRSPTRDRDRSKNRICATTDQLVVETARLLFFCSKLNHFQRSPHSLKRSSPKRYPLNILIINRALKLYKKLKSWFFFQKNRKFHPKLVEISLKNNQKNPKFYRFFDFFWQFLKDISTKNGSKFRFFEKKDDFFAEKSNWLFRDKAARTVFGDLYLKGMTSTYWRLSLLAPSS